ncbi:dihydrofolate reductase family protein [Amycolatopsis marina]|uniref:dihydrofolate reductase family protein n=1 Tax=Amycolatopsis marina TaxID=490629 RepID=UPI000B8927B3|nr:dihydrofolate reductase family protein [Amycolatopsis marina]
MRKLTYLVASTIDGYIAGPDGSDPSGNIFPLEGDHAQPLMTKFPEMLPVHVREMLGVAPENINFDTVLEGRGSFQMGLDVGIPDAYPHLRHYVFSRTLTPDPGSAVRFVADDPLKTVRGLKREPGMGIWLCGGGTLAAALLPEIDELFIKLNPVVIGKGIPLFAGGFQLNRFTLAETTTYGDSGVMLLHYVR